MERDHQRPGQGFFGRCCKPIFVTSNQVATSKKAGQQRECQHDGRQRVVKLKQRFTKDEAAKTEHDAALALGMGQLGAIRAVAFSVGGDDGRRSPEPLTLFPQAVSDCRTIEIYEYTPLGIPNSIKAPFARWGWTWWGP
jgi:hypothetical protein